MKKNYLNFRLNTSCLLVLSFICGVFQISAQLNQKNYNLKEIKRNDIWVIFPDDFCNSSYEEMASFSPQALPQNYSVPTILFHQYESIDITYEDIIKKTGNNSFLKRKWNIHLQDGSDNSNIYHTQHFYNINVEDINKLNNTNSKKFKAEISPNPFTSEIYIKIKEKSNSPLQVTILDINSKIVFFNVYDRLVENVFINSLDGLIAGTYFITISTDSWVETNKIIRIN